MAAMNSGTKDITMNQWGEWSVHAKITDFVNTNFTKI